MEAVTARRQKILPIALRLFGKIQDTHLTTKHLNDVNEAHLENFEESINKLDLLLNNQASPILSAIKGTAKYKNINLENKIE